MTRMTTCEQCPLVDVYNTRYDALDKKVDSIAADVKSLLETRSFARGAWRTVVVVATAVSTAVGIIVGWVRHW